MSAALFRLFTTPMLFPTSSEMREIEEEARKGNAEPAMQGHADCYRITPDGYRDASRRWGHQQIGDRP